MADGVVCRSVLVVLVVLVDLGLWVALESGNTTLYRFLLMEGDNKRSRLEDLGEVGCAIGFFVAFVAEVKYGLKTPNTQGRFFFKRSDIVYRLV